MGEDILYEGNGLKVTGACIEIGRAAYATNYMTKIEKKDEFKEPKPWWLPLTILGVMCALFFFRQFIQEQIRNGVTGGLSISFFLGAWYYHSKYKSIENYFIFIHTTEEEFKLTFKDQKDRNEAFEALGIALSYWRVEQHERQGSQSRMEKFHQQYTKDV